LSLDTRDGHLDRGGHRPGGLAAASGSTVRVARAGLAAAVLAAPLVAVVPFPMLAVGLAAAALAAAVAIHPPLAAYLLLATTPLIVGIERGLVIPALRPSEALILLVGAGLVARRLLLLAAGHPLRLRLRAVEASIVAMAVTSSLTPLLWMVARGRQVTTDDVLYALVLWKFFGLYLVVRASIRTERQVHRCLWICLVVACVVAVVAILQALNLLGVPDLLSRYYVTPGEAEDLAQGRGTATLGSSFAVADVLTINLAIACGLLLWKRRRPVVLVGIAALLLLGIPASGQFSAIVELVVAIAAVGLLTRRIRGLGAILLCLAPIAALLFRPVVAARFSQIDPTTGLPSSWLARLRNLRSYFWPELFSDFNFVLGVRPSARIRVHRSWTDYVWIESGHTWLLWGGGIPLFLAFWWFLVVSLRTTARVARARADAIGVAGLAGFTGLCVVAVLMVLDPHLTLRGTADLLFPLIALACTANPLRPRRGSERPSEVST
jgi:hypothetical protein